MLRDKSLWRVALPEGTHSDRGSQQQQRERETRCQEARAEVSSFHIVNRNFCQTAGTFERKLHSLQNSGLFIGDTPGTAVGSANSYSQHTG
ncbi:hypothetical protein NQZ68_024597 [Dissostichus eleginoides]|nr:hypothetical protein NQZ68_024597 [Dissostichus eleginoides]